MAVDLQTLAIIILLIGAFVVAYKVLKMLMETALVSLISSAFYVSLSVIMGYPTSIDSVLTFAFLGATLYMVYGLIASAFMGISKIFNGISSVLKPIINGIIPNKSKQEKRIRKLEKKLEKYGSKLKDKGKDSNDDEEKPDTVKEVVLGNEKED